jgi:hypothetical protein
MWAGLRRLSFFLALLVMLAGAGVGCSASVPEPETAYSAVGAAVK